MPLLAYGLLLRAAYGSFDCCGTAYGLFEGAGDPDFEPLEREPNNEAFFESRSASPSPFLRQLGMVVLVLLGICGIVVVVSVWENNEGGSVSGESALWRCSRQPFSPRNSFQDKDSDTNRQHNSIYQSQNHEKTSRQQKYGSTNIDLCWISKTAFFLSCLRYHMRSWSWRPLW